MGCSTSKQTDVADKREQDAAVAATAAEEPPKASEQPKARQPGDKNTVSTPPAKDTDRAREVPQGPDGPAASGSEEPLPPDTTIVFVLGGPGSGKGTQCEKIVAKYGYHHLSAGDLLRAEVKSGSALGQELQGTMAEGKLVPTRTTVALLRKAMQASPASTFLIDGFPRALDQAETFERDVLPCALVLFFDLDEETMRKRLLKRGETSGRADDNEATITKRFQTFTSESLPVISHYEQQGKAARISAVAAPDAVFERVQEALSRLGPSPGATQPLGGAQEKEALLAA